MLSRNFYNRETFDVVVPATQLTRERQTVTK